MRRNLFGLLVFFLGLAVPLAGARAIDSEALREDIIAGLALLAGPSTAAPVSYDEVRVRPQAAGHRVEIAGLVSRSAELGYWADLGDVAFSVEEGKPGQFRVFDLDAPGDVPVYDAAGQRFALLTYRLERFDGVWVAALSNFLELDLLATALRFGLADGSFVLSLDHLGGVSRAQEAADGRIDQQAKGRAMGLRAEAAGEGAFEVAEVAAETSVSGLDLDAYAQLTREYEALAARPGGASDADMAAFIQRMSGFNVLPAGFGERFSLSDLRAIDAGGQTLLRLDQAELDFAGSGFDQAAAELRFGLKHEDLEMGDGLRAQAGQMGALTPRRSGMVVAIERLPADRLWQSLLRTLAFAVTQGGLQGETSGAMRQMLTFMMLGEALPALTEAGTELKLPHFVVESDAAAMSGEGAFEVNPAAPQGVTGGLRLAITGLDQVIALLAAEVNAGNQDAIGALGMANWLKTLGRRETDGQSRAVDRFDLQLTADGRTLLNGQPFAVPAVPR